MIGHVYRRALSRGRLLPAWTLTSGRSGPTSFGSGGLTLASSGSGDMVGTFAVMMTVDCRPLSLFQGAMSPGNFLSNSATYSGKTFATLGVTPGTYVWTWGTGANQNFTLQIPVPHRRQ